MSDHGGLRGGCHQSGSIQVMIAMRSCWRVHVDDCAVFVVERVVLQQTEEALSSLRCRERDQPGPLTRPVVAVQCGQQLPRLKLWSRQIHHTTRIGQVGPGQLARPDRRGEPAVVGLVRSVVRSDTNEALHVAP